MTEPQRAIDAALTEAERLRKSLRQGKSKQVSADDDRRVIKATSLTWFNNHRNEITRALDADLLINVDSEYRGMLVASEKATLRTHHLDNLKRIKTALAQVQSDHVLSLSATQSQLATSDTPPHFTPLVTDLKMQAILGNRWQECVRCVDHGAPLAAVVMMGGILEGLLLARVNQLKDKSPVFKATSAPKDHKTGNTLTLKDWGLSNYLDVAYELKWISKTTKDVGGVVRDYRNYVHPQKEYSHGVSISPGDAKMLWEISKRVARQVLEP